MMWHHGYLGGMGGWGLLSGLIGLLLFLGLIIALAALVIWAWRRAGDRPTLRPQREPAAHEILAARYARGEIERDEYLKRREDLSAGRL